VYRDIAGECDWLKSFNSIVDENGLTLAKDKIQIKMCAKLLLMHLNDDQMELPAIDEYVTPITQGSYGAERITVIRDFPENLRMYVLQLEDNFKSVLPPKPTSDQLL
jgi:hypothetical protein